MEEGEKQETDKNMEVMWALLRDHSSVPLMELVLNPRDPPAVGFGQTVENLFGLSFLVRLGSPPPLHSHYHTLPLPNALPGACP